MMDLKNSDFIWKLRDVSTTIYRPINKIQVDYRDLGSYYSPHGVLSTRKNSQYFAVVRQWSIM